MYALGNYFSFKCITFLNYGIYSFIFIFLSKPHDVFKIYKISTAPSFTDIWCRCLFTAVLENEILTGLRSNQFSPGRICWFTKSFNGINPIDNTASDFLDSASATYGQHTTVGALKLLFLHKYYTLLSINAAVDWWNSHCHVQKRIVRIARQWKDTKYGQDVTTWHDIIF